MSVQARQGQPLETEWSAGKARVVICSPEPLGEARQRPLDEDMLRAQLGRLGNTPYELAALSLETEGAPFAPVALLNQMRREAVERLQEEQGKAGQAGPACAIHTTVKRLDVGQAVSPANLPRREQLAGETASPTSAVSLHLLVRTAEQLDAALEFRPDGITLDYLDLYGLKPSLERVRAAGILPRVASPRVLKPGEARIADFLLSCDCPILVRPAGLLYMLREKLAGGSAGPALIGDFSLNAANALTAAELLQMGLEALTPAHDLNAEQVAGLARAVGPEWIEAVAYQHLPVFHTEHCVFCRFLSTGTSYRDCGRPCEQHRVALRDSAGREHPVLADVGCRNTVFGAEAQQAARHLDAWRAAGIRRFRLEFAHESGEEVAEVARAFADVLAGRMSARELAARLPRLAPQGVTEGSLFVPEGYQALPVLQ